MEKFELTVEANKLRESGIIPLSHATVGTEKVPIYINVDTGFDYAGVATAVIGFVVALVVGWFTVTVQRNQIQANISNFRHQWMVELRDCASELLQLFLVITNKASRYEEYKAGGEYYSDRSRAAQLNAKLALLLSRDDERSEAIRKTSVKVLESLRDLKVGGDRSVRFTHIGRLQNLIREELESAWQDTKHDLGINRHLLRKRIGEYDGPTS